MLKVIMTQIKGEKASLSSGDPQNGPGDQLHARTVSGTQSWHTFVCAAHTPLQVCAHFFFDSLCFFFRARGIVCFALYFGLTLLRWLTEQLLSNGPDSPTFFVKHELKLTILVVKEGP
jgi:hypothetical protein